MINLWQRFSDTGCLCQYVFKEPKKRILWESRKVFWGVAPVQSVHELCHMPYDTWEWPSIGCGCMQKHAASVSQHDLWSSRRKPCPSSNNSSIKWNLIIGILTAEVSRGISSMALLWPTYLLSQQHEWVEPLFTCDSISSWHYCNWLTHTNNPQDQ